MAFSLDRLIVEMRGRIVFVEVFVEAIFVGKRCRLPEALDDALVFIRDTVRKIASVVRTERIVTWMNRLRIRSIMLCPPASTRRLWPL